MTWPVVTCWPAATESSPTVPARGARTSFSIFIASTMQTTWPASTVSPSTGHVAAPNDSDAAPVRATTAAMRVAAARASVSPVFGRMSANSSAP